MAMFKKLTTDTTVTKTHAVVDGSLMDIINPMSLPGDATTSLMKSALYGAVGYFGRGYKETGKFSL